MAHSIWHMLENVTPPHWDIKEIREGERYKAISPDGRYEWELRQSGEFWYSIASINHTDRRYQVKLFKNVNPHEATEDIGWFTRELVEGSRGEPTPGLFDELDRLGQ